MEIAQLLLGMIFLNVVYHTGQLIWAYRWGIHHKHYFIGRGPKLFAFQFRGMHFTVGIYIPFFGLAKIYEYESGVKKRAWSSWEFSGHSLWKRFTMAMGGVFSLMLSGILIFIWLAYIEKESFVSREEVNKYGIYPSAIATEAGFKRGDRVLQVNGHDYEGYSQLLQPQEGTRYTIDRDGNELDLVIDKEIATKLMETGHTPFLSVWAPFKIREIVPNSIADYTGIKAGDQIKEINHYPIISLNEFKEAISLDEDGIIDLRIRREGATEDILFSAVPLAEEGRLGFFSEDLIQYSIRQNSISESVQKGLSQSFKIITSNLRAFSYLFAGAEVQNKNVKGPIGIAGIFGGEYLWQRFWSITAMLALWISFLNLLPLPNTAFWHMMPLFYEATTRKIFPYTAYLKIKRFGFYAAILLMASVLLSDILQLFF